MRRAPLFPARRLAAATVLFVITAILSPLTAPALGFGALSGPQFPPPGGATLTKSTCTAPFPGSDTNPPCEGLTGGRTLTYSAMNPSLFTDFYWGPSGLPQLSLNGTGAPPGGAHNAVNIPFSGIVSAKVARWLCQPTACNIPIFTFSGGGSGTANLWGRFTATITSGPDWVLATTKGLPASVGVVVPVTGDFAAHILFEVSTNGTSWTPAVHYYNISSTDPARHTFTSFGSGFYFNRAPTALDGALTTDEDTAASVVLNVSDPDGNDLQYTIGTPSHGSLSGTAPNLTYTPALNYNGPDSFSYMVSDGFAVTASANVAIDVFPINDAPVADDQSVTTDEEAPVTFTLTGSDVDNLQGDLLFAVVDPTTHGQLDLSALPTVTYTPDADYFGSDSLTFDIYDGALHTSPLGTVSITVNPINDAPVSIDANLETNEDTPLDITLQATDVDNVLGDLTFSIVDGPAHGQFDPAPDGSNALHYVPETNFNGTDTFTFQVNDGSLDSAIATVTIVVQDVNDAPVADNQDLTTNEDTTLPVGLTASDVDNTQEELTFIVTEPPAHGQLAGGGAALAYTPDQDYNGPDLFKFKANDGNLDSNEATISITVNAINDAPVADDNISVETAEDNAIGVTLTGYDVDTPVEGLAYSIVDGPAHGTLVGSGTDYVYTPDADYFGSDSFTFKINDGALDSNTATVSINVTPVNDAPLAHDQTLSTDEDTTLPVVLTGSDVDNDITLLSFEIIDGPTHGTLSGSGAALMYTPFQDYHGPDAFTFKINDGELDSNIATVSITVAAVNDNPVAGDDVASTPQYTPVTFDVLGNDTDVDGDSVTISDVGTPFKGSATANPDGTITYTPNANFKGSDMFTYTISDGNGGSAVGGVTVLEEGCGEDGIDALKNTPAQGVASEVIDKTVEPAVGGLDPALAETLHEFNCANVVPLEDTIDDALGTETAAKAPVSPAAASKPGVAAPAVPKVIP